MLTSDPTSDSSDAGASGKSNGEQNSVNNSWDSSSRNNSDNGKPSFDSQKENELANDSSESNENNMYIGNSKDNLEESSSNVSYVQNIFEIIISYYIDVKCISHRITITFQTITQTRII